MLVHRSWSLLPFRGQRMRTGGTTASVHVTRHSVTLSIQTLALPSPYSTVTPSHIIPTSVTLALYPHTPSNTHCHKGLCTPASQGVTLSCCHSDTQYILAFHLSNLAIPCHARECHAHCACLQSGFCTDIAGRHAFRHAAQRFRDQLAGFTAARIAGVAANVPAACFLVECGGELPRFDIAPAHIENETASELPLKHDRAVHRSRKALRAGDRVLQIVGSALSLMMRDDDRNPKLTGKCAHPLTAM